MIVAFCRRCGREFEAVNRGRHYCSTFCRRKYQDERRKDERAEARDVRLMDVLVTQWRADYGLDYHDQCTSCRYAKLDAKTQKKGRPASIVCDACRMA